MTTNESVILLQDIWQIDDLAAYKVHFARRAKDGTNPLDVWARDTAEWQGWQKYWAGRNDFNLPYIFALMDFYHEPDNWLFGGIFRVLSRSPKGYEVQLTGQHKNFIGRLKIRHRYSAQQPRATLKNYYNDFQLYEILSKPYTKEA